MEVEIDCERGKAEKMEGEINRLKKEVGRLMGVVGDL